MAVMGPDIQPLGEIKTKTLLYQKQIAATIAGLLQQRFICEHTVGEAIPIPRSTNQESEAQVVLRSR